jgi:methylenetetrahydrofolate--tRNA-(uracil-5-)-methyltransferase
VFAGQITGVEGYVESTACGFLAGLFTAARLKGLHDLPLPPAVTAFGALLEHVTASQSPDYQPSNINFGLFAPLEGRNRKRDKKAAYRDRALEAVPAWASATEAVLGAIPLPQAPRSTVSEPIVTDLPAFP